MLDLRPRFQAPSAEDYSSARGADPLATFLQTGLQGFGQGQQAAQVLAERRRKQELAKGLQDFLSNSPNPQHNLLSKMVNEDTAEPIATKIASEVEKPQNTGPSRQLFRDPKTGIFGDSPIDGVQPYTVPEREAITILSGQNKQDAMQSRLDEMIKARTAADQIRNENMQKNRIARLVIAQQGKNFKIDKANLDNTVKNLAGFGINLTPDDILKAYQDVTGEKVTPSSAGNKSVKQNDRLGIR